MINGKRVVALIPARCGSKGVPGKNVKLLSGKPLLAYSIECALRSQYVDDVIVSTDSREYATLSERMGAKVPFMRPPEISEDKSTDYEMVAHYLSWTRAANENVDFIIHLRPTSPLRRDCVIDEAIEVMSTSLGSYTSLRSVHVQSESAYKMMEIDESSQCLVTVFERSPELDLSNQARQSFPCTYVPNGYVDVLRVDFIEKEKRLHGNCVYGFKTEFCPEVDTFEDFDYIEFLIKKGSL